MTKNKFYKDVNANSNFADIENDIIKNWQENQVFEQSVEERPATIDGNHNEYIFYDGPPFANGLPHYGHLLTGYVKDVFARYQTTKGKRVERKFGWDCHGLPAEMGAEKELKISGRNQIMDFGIDNFNDHCRTSVMKYTGEWEEYVTRQARWVDFEGGYKTMDTGYMESVLWAFKQLYNKGLLYESMRVMPYSWACETPLSNFETRMDNSYREKTSKAITVAFELKEKPAGAPEASKYKLLAWTTTPWTLPSNLALAVGKDIEYVCVQNNQIGYIIAKSSIKNYEQELRKDLKIDESQWDIMSCPTSFSKNENFLIIPTNDARKKIDLADSYIEVSNLEKTKEIFGEDEYIIYTPFKGSDLVGLKYNPLFPYFEGTDGAFKVIAADFVEEGDGTGIVHLAPGFGEDDQAVCADNGISVICPVDNGGKFNNETYSLEYELAGNNNTLELTGRQVFDTNDDIIKYLKSQQLWIKTEQYIHNYPHCWRTDTPLIYKAVPSWYVKVTEFKDKMVELNQKINWTPNHVKDGLFGKWLENARDWSISRNRFWGCPVPIWKSDNPNNKELYVFGSIKELEEFFGEEVKDLHRPFIDNLTKPDPLDPQYTLRRVEDVLDCWFESGSMPYAQAHYPFENKEWFESHFSADFIVEYTAQTRGWFYTLMVLHTALHYDADYNQEKLPPFKNVICHGVVLDDKGQKLSKRLNNYADPKDLFAKYGSDALRWLMVSSPIMRGGELLIDKEGNMVRDAVRLAIKPIWNAYNFFVLYANSDGIKAELTSTSDNLMDQYIFAKLKNAVTDIEAAMDNYDTPTACQAAVDFFEVLNNWYIRRSRPRFWKKELDDDKQSAYNTLYTTLTVMCEAISPLLPMLTEEIYQGL